MMLMVKNKSAVAALAALVLMQSVPAFAATPAFATTTNTGVGRLIIKEAPTPTAEELALSSISTPTKKPNMGKINIADEIIDEVFRKSKKKDSKEVVRVKKQLAEAIEAANDFDYDKTLTIMKHLHVEHPESRVLIKWLGVYQNWNGQYEESLATFDEWRDSYPLAVELADEDFMVAYYITDNRRHLGFDVDDNIAALKKLAEKERELVLTGGMSRKALAQTLVDYQKFMVESDCGLKLKPTDSKILDDLWKQIPKTKQAHLDNYFGYNIDELTPVYATFYRRSDLMEEYNGRREKREKHIADATIKEKTEVESPKADGKQPAPKDIPVVPETQDRN